MRSAAEIFATKIERLRQFFVDAHATQAVVALSGGVDSAVVVALAVEALGADNVRVVMLPTRYSSACSVSDSVLMAARCAVRGEVVDIEPIFGESLRAVEPLFDIDNCGVATENMQSRIRCMITMAVANATGALMLNTSNRTEILVGYGTLYGDTSGAVGVIADLYKDEVYALARYINSLGDEIIPSNIIERAPSAELRANQVDSDSLPPYPLLDAILRLMVDEGMPLDEIGHLYDIEIVRRVASLNRASAFKRAQLPPSL